jgi:hypothetical protein
MLNEGEGNKLIAWLSIWHFTKHLQRGNDGEGMDTTRTEEERHKDNKRKRRKNIILAFSRK